VCCSKWTARTIAVPNVDAALLYAVYYFRGICVIYLHSSHIDATFVIKIYSAIGSARCSSYDDMLECRTLNFPLNSMASVGPGMQHSIVVGMVHFPRDAARMRFSWFSCIIAKLQKLCFHNSESLNISTSSI
jgi:hypothetical protein